MGNDEDVERAREGIASLRAWFFLAAECNRDPDDVTEPFPSFDLVEMDDTMDGSGADDRLDLPAGAISLIDFYRAFCLDADSKTDHDGKRKALAKQAGQLLGIFDFNKKPDINVGVRFFFHLSHALKTPTPGGYVRADRDPCVVVQMPLDARRLSHIYMPLLCDDATERQKAAWSDPETGQYDEEKLSYWLQVQFNVVSCMVKAHPHVKLSVACLACNCVSCFAENNDETVCSMSSYLKATAVFCCPHCGVHFSCLNPHAEVMFVGVALKNQ